MPVTYTISSPFRSGELHTNVLGSLWDISNGRTDNLSLIITNSPLLYLVYWLFPKTQLKSYKHEITVEERKSETNHKGIAFDHDYIGHNQSDNRI